MVIGLSACDAAGVTLTLDRVVRSRSTSPALAVIAGVAFGAWASIPRLTHDGPAPNTVGALFVVIGITSYAAALRRGTAVSMMAITVAAESILPALCGLAVGDTARPGPAASRSPVRCWRSQAPASIAVALIRPGFRAPVATTLHAAIRCVRSRDVAYRLRLGSQAIAMVRMVIVDQSVRPSWIDLPRNSATICQLVTTLSTVFFVLYCIAGRELRHDARSSALVVECSTTNPCPPCE